MRDTARMQCDRTAFDSAARPKISADVKQNLIRLHIVVHPRNFYGFGMRIEQSRSERANDVTANFKRLMDRRRLMDRSGNRLEILGVESERIEITIPPDHIEWIVRHGHARKSGAILDQKIDILLFVDGDQFARPVQI